MSLVINYDFRYDYSEWIRNMDYIGKCIISGWNINC